MALDGRAKGQGQEPAVSQPSKTQNCLCFRERFPTGDQGIVRDEGYGPSKARTTRE